MLHLATEAIVVTGTKAPLLVAQQQALVVLHNNQLQRQSTCSSGGARGPMVVVRVQPHRQSLDLDCFV